MLIRGVGSEDKSRWSREKQLLTTVRHLVTDYRSRYCHKAGSDELAIVFEDLRKRNDMMAFVFRGRGGRHHLWHSRRYAWRGHWAVIVKTLENLLGIKATKMVRLEWAGWGREKELAKAWPVVFKRYQKEATRLENVIFK